MAAKRDLDAELHSVENELGEIESKLKTLRERQQELIELRDTLKDKRALKKSQRLGKKNWERSNFDWSTRLKLALKAVFDISEFRPQQLSAMNATLSGNNALVVMPTGAGKSLCYQLPAIISEGITVVVSPLISLMEDQVMSLTKRNVFAKLMTSTTSKGEVNQVFDEMTENRSPLKLLYVAPERFAKSKRFMAKLQKCYANGRLQRFAIDEVHCCSQWGHDFRPDYRFLGVLTSMFPEVPILGLTATATTQVLMDVQKMLDIRGCLTIKSTFNRPNLYYHIIDKPPSAEECINIFESLLKNRYKGESGIIYATCIKDCEELTKGLRSRGLKVACYHASLEPDRRSAIHIKWIQKYYQAVIATVAFGLGIDKPDVRFVLHHSLSKAMESYYQESGRAGRDGERAECIMMYRMQDMFRVSTLVFSSSGSLQHLYSMVRYCLDPSSCRRKIIASHFDEDFGDEDCRKMCDRCCESSEVQQMAVEKYCIDLYKIIRFAAKQDIKVTAQKLLDSWFKKGALNLRMSELEHPKLSRLQGERVVTYLLIEGYLKEDFHFTAYNTISYIKIGPKSAHLDDENHKIIMKYTKFHSLNIDGLAPSTFSNLNVNNESQNTSSTQTGMTQAGMNQKETKQRKRKVCEILESSDEDFSIADVNDIVTVD